MVDRYIEFFSTLWGEELSDKRTPGRWDYVILDEGHKVAFMNSLHFQIRNRESSMSRSIQSLIANHRIVLSGTPIQNNLLEMWTIMDWLSEHRLLGDHNFFNTHYKRPIEKGQMKDASVEERAYARYLADDLRDLIFSMTLRREKAAVLKNSKDLNLGKKTEIVLWW